MSTDSSYDFAPHVAPATPPTSNPPADEPASLAAPHGRVAERPCPQCGFLIVGKPRNNRCPECRAPLDDSLSDRLQFSDSRWTRQLSWGALAIALAIPAHILGGYLTGLAHDPLRGSALQVIGAVITLTGIWMVTIAEKKTPPPKPALLAIAARWLALASAALWVGATVIASRQGNALWLMTPALAVMAGEAVAFGLFASKLATRIPHDGLINQLRNYALLLPPFFAFLIFCLFNDTTAYLQIFFCSFPLIGALTGLLLWVAATQVRLFLELRSAATAADAVVQRHLQAAETAARAAAARSAATSKPPED